MQKATDSRRELKSQVKVHWDTLNPGYEVDFVNSNLKGGKRKTKNRLDT